jgi:membrane protease YdiL (CAAX protease family)
MMRAVSPPDHDRTGAAATWALLTLGVLALLLRMRVLALPDADRVLVLILLFAALLCGSLLVPAGHTRRASVVRSSAVLAVGVAGVGAAAIAAGRPAAVPFGPWALPSSVLAAVAEEAFFRRTAYAAVERRGGPVAAVFVTAVAFAAIHVPLYGTAAFPVDLGAGLLFGWQRWETGDWTMPAATHVAANLIAVISR